jgi:hypothetical protein
MPVQCPHCSTPLPPQEIAAGWCETCGKKLPPKLLPPLPPSTSVTGYTERPEQPPELPTRHESSDYPDVEWHEDRSRKRKPSTTTATILFVIAGLQLLCGLMVVTVLPNLGNVFVDEERVLLLFVDVIGIGAVFLGLGIWALRQPVPAGTIGLILYIVLGLYNLARNPEHISKGIWVRILVVVFLVQAINKAAQEKRRREKIDY